MAHGGAQQMQIAGTCAAAENGRLDERSWLHPAPESLDCRRLCGCAVQVGAVKTGMHALWAATPARNDMVHAALMCYLAPTSSNMFYHGVKIAYHRIPVAVVCCLPLVELVTQLPVANHGICLLFFIDVCARWTDLFGGVGMML